MTLRYVFAAGFLAVFSSAVQAQLPNAERGAMLYQNHCGGCHEAHVHSRKSSKINGKETLQAEVLRWSAELELYWQLADIRDVTEYLYLKYYDD